MIVTRQACCCIIIVLLPKNVVENRQRVKSEIVQPNQPIFSSFVSQSGIQQLLHSCILFFCFQLFLARYKIELFIFWLRAFKQADKGE